MQLSPLPVLSVLPWLITEATVTCPSMGPGTAAEEEAGSEMAAVSIFISLQFR